jgi:hypothetical protein
MGVLEIAVAAIILIAGTVGGSAVAGALLGRNRDIGAGKGFGWGLLLPVIGLGRVLASPKKERTADRKKEAPVSIEQRQPEDMKESAREAARERFRKDNPKSGTLPIKSGTEAVPETSQSQIRGVRRS